MKPIVPVAAVAWVAMSLISLAALNANWRAKITCRFPGQFSQRTETRDFRVKAVLSALPPFWLVGFGVTGAYSDGFTFDHGPCFLAERRRRA